MSDVNLIVGWTLFRPDMKEFNYLQLFIFRTFSHLESDVPVGGIVFHKHIFVVSDQDLYGNFQNRIIHCFVSML